ncbi:ATP synthase mitochondrial F1 complex assembly factor 1 [Babesia caballi]|uniref:ATP synthase mitochondrial F1 complex assembly factor 1 n=1 Tax=Babesia caballi TaxID=5871 RepID=A0AAV4LQM8_BABCB|nr:ATP synthase mitochondrial F1 complex assembly factor 1 [Babesia caballi]
MGDNVEIGTKNDKKINSDLSDCLSKPAIDHINRIATTFMLLHDDAERYVKCMNHKNRGITVAEVVDDLLEKWPPTIVHQDWSFMYPVPRTLNEVAKVPLLLQHDPQTIAGLWQRQFEQRNDVVTCTVDAGSYRQLSNNAKRSPMFILPVQVDRRGTYNMVLQYVDTKSVLFTSVDSFKVLGMERSPPYFILTFFDELVAQKNIVLVRGDIVNPKDVSKVNAKRLMEATVRFYTDMNLYHWVEGFNHRPREFIFDQFVSKCKHVLG